MTLLAALRNRGCFQPFGLQIPARYSGLPCNATSIAERHVCFAVPFWVVGLLRLFQMSIAVVDENVMHMPMPRQT
jgi:hypothetical protein